MCGLNRNGVPLDQLDPAAAHMWQVHPEGPPVEVYEPQVSEKLAVDQTRICEQPGMGGCRRSVSILRGDL